MSDLRKIIIDDQELEVDGAMTLIQACEEAGIEIRPLASTLKVSSPLNLRTTVPWPSRTPPRFEETDP